MSRRERKLLRRQGKEYKPEEPKTQQEEVTPAASKKQKVHPFVQFFEKYNIRMMWITVILLIASLVVIGVHTAVTGEFIPRGVSLKGGITATIPYDGGAITSEGLQTYLEGQFPSASISVRDMSGAGSGNGFLIDASDLNPDDMLKSIEKKTGKLEKFSIETMESALGQAFFKQVLLAMLAAFVLMSIVVFMSFKTFVPSAAVIISAVSDIIMTIAVIDLFGIKVETAGIAALLMLIGYSVDTDILLTTRVLKREEGTVMDRIMGAMKTGMTMTVTAIVAVLVAYIFTQSETLRQIMLILMIGLLFDILNTWIQNTGILRLYVQHKAKKQAAATLADYKEKDAEFEEIVDLEEETEEDRKAAEEEKEETEEKKEEKHHTEHHTEHHEHAEHHAHAEHTHEHHTHQHTTTEEKK